MAHEMARDLGATTTDPELLGRAERARTACLGGELGTVRANLLLMEVQSATKDGRIDPAEGRALADGFDRVLPSP
jgi:hypothetical protein